MLMANQRVAEMLARRACRLYRVHEAPDPDAVALLRHA
jgi:exoribonuclease R